MRNLRLPVSPASVAALSVGTLAAGYLALIAVVMTYAALTIEFSQSIRSDEAQVASLEAQYLSGVERITGTDYVSAGYAKPIAETFIPSRGATALR